MIVIENGDKDLKYYNSMVSTIAGWRGTPDDIDSIKEEIDEWIQDTMEIARALNEELVYREMNDILYIYECVTLSDNEKDECVNIYYIPYKMEFTRN